jgi:glycosyltransferase involved in cell wall biosynthesis
MKILIISFVMTHPPTAGNRARVGSLIAGLESLGHDIVFAYVPYATDDCSVMKERLGDRLRILQASPPPFPRSFRRVQRKIARAFGRKSAHRWAVDEWFDDSLVSQVQRLQATERFDAVLIEYVLLSKLAAALPNSVRTIIDTHDLMGDRHIRYLAAGLLPDWFTTSPAEEISALNRADAVIAIQQSEADYLRQNLSAGVFCVGHLLGPEVSPLPDPGSARVLFVGSGNPINVQGLEWFANSVFPKIRREMPNSELAIAGPIGNARRWPDGMLKLGNLESLKDAYACATLVINPVKFGTGIPVKTIEALGYGKPVVATPAGIRGIERDFDGAVLVAESEDAFAEQVLGLLASANARSAMSRNALIAVHEWQRRQLAALQAAVTGRPIPSEKSGFYAEKGASAPADA